VAADAAAIAQRRHVEILQRQRVDCGRMVPGVYRQCGLCEENMIDDMERIETAETKVLDWIIVIISCIVIVFFIVEKLSG
jgi:hypothetical protein